MNDFQKIKSALNLTQVITQSTGFQMKKNHLEECPFCHGHDCFSIDANKQLYKCFQCPDSGGGDVFTFLKAFYSLDDKSTLRKGAELAGISLKQPLIKRISAVDRIFLEAAEYYHEYMLENGARKYLTEKRGHTVDTLKKLRVGYSDGKLHDHLRHKKFSDEDILKSGLVRKKEINNQTTYYDFFSKDLVIYPHINSGIVHHFTIKDPKKEKAYQLKSEHRNKKWLFYNQEALNHDQDVILVEGENDIQSLMDIGYSNVIAQIGQTSEAQIKALNSHCRKKRLILWLDNDEINPKTKEQPGHSYIRKICSKLSDIDIKIVLYPDNQDPDEYIQNFKGDRQKEVERLLSEAVDYITWEIIQAGRLTELEQKLNALKKYEIFNKIALQSQVQQQIYIEKLQEIGFEKKSVTEQIEDQLDIRRRLNIYYEQLTDKSKADPNLVAGIIHNSLDNEGRFFFDRKDKVYLLYNKKVYEISNNRPFNALMKKLSMLLPTESPGRSVWESLASEGYNSGYQIDVENWIMTNDKTDTIYLNFNSPNNTILKINYDGIKEIDNGLNDDQVLLKSSDLIQPFTYMPDADPREGFAKLKELVFDNLTCDLDQRYLIICWMISAFLFDFTESQALMKFAGASASGKSTGAKLLTLLIYGNKQVGAPSAAAAFSESSQNPLLVIDNLETEDLTKGMKNFLLLASSKNAKTKRTSGTESGTTKESPKSLVLITAIEPFPKSEMINRTIEIDFYKKYHNDEFIENEVTRELIKHRDLIISCILKVISSSILPILSKRRSFMSILQKEYKNHSKDRLNDHLSLMMLILEKILKYLPYYTSEDFQFGLETGDYEIRKSWIEYQNLKARETEVGSNDIVRLLDGLIREYKLRMSVIDLKTEIKNGYTGEVYQYCHPEYGLEIVKTQPEFKVDEKTGDQYSVTIMEFEATSGDIVPAFNMYCKNFGLKNPYPTTAVFGSRLKNDLSTLKKAGWELITRNDSDLYSRRIKGQRYFRFRKSIITVF